MRTLHDSIGEKVHYALAHIWLGLETDTVLLRFLSICTHKNKELLNERHKTIR